MFRVVVCPYPPLLLPGAGGAADPLAQLRGEAVRAIRSQLATPPAEVHLVGAGGSPWPGSTLPLSLAVGEHLLDLAGWTGERRYHPLPEAPVPEELHRSVVILLADGSARRTDASPGPFDPRAEDFDSAIERALASGDATALAGLDEALGAELMAAGVPALRLLGGWGGRLGVSASELIRAESPYGVAYWVAVWQLAG